jgi:alpha-L-fucosidase
MIRYFLSGIILSLFSIGINNAQVKAPAPFGPVPTENQMRWQEMEYYAFIHFSLNTYTDQWWGFGNENVKLFNPEKADCRQWARICKEAGMKGIIITAKHHCGFCLWPSKYTEYSVKNSPWKNGQGDMVREMADACKEYGLKLGIYLSPWDRNSAVYGEPEYITYFRNQLTELLTNYGPIFEVWFDGANGGSGYYGGANETRNIDRTTYYDWSNTYKLVRKLQPDIVIWNDGGDRADLRWVGTEAGFVGETNWSLLNAKGDVPYDMLHYGLENGNSWVPSEVNTSIRPEWFYHPGEDAKVKTVPKLMDTYYNSIGRNGTLLLNFPIMPDGLIHPNDEKAALDFAEAVKEAFAVNLAEKTKAEASNVRGNAKEFEAIKAIDGKQDTYWATDDNVTKASLTIDFGKPTAFNRFLVQEYIRLGQRVKAFTIEAFVDGNWKELAKTTTIGYKRILRFPTVKATKLRFSITDSKSCPVISNIGIYNAPQILDAPSIVRDQSGEIILTPVDTESVVFYTLDGSVPTPDSRKYTGSFQTEGKVELRTIACEPASGKSSPESHEKFDLPRKDWKIVGINDEKAYLVLDGNQSTAWHQGKDNKLPIDLVIDLGKEQSLSGFRYFPDQGLWGPGIITNYEFYVSTDNKEWKIVDQGEFSNIKNNPLWQVKKFTPEKARYIKFKALKNTEGNDNIGYAEVDVITVSAQVNPARNPVIFADVPDMSMIRVGDTYYMSSTTMHMCPGVPIMKSKDLVNWQTIGYAYEALGDNDAMNLINNTNAYGRGTWASCLRYHNNTFYLSTFSSTTGKTYIFSTKDIEKGAWKENSFSPSLHDNSLFFDDDGRIYMIYGNIKLRKVELNADLSGTITGTDQVLIENAGAPSPPDSGLAEGSQLFKINGKYYLFNITWPRGGMRTVVVHRADKITGPWEGKLALQDKGVAQGGLVDTPDGKWFAYLFRDYGSVGRIPYLVPVKWENGWPVIGIDGKVPDTLDLPASKGFIPGIIAPDEFNREKGDNALPLVWQWNHNPDNDLWSVTRRKGYLRLTTGRIDTGFVSARNTLTQRTFGPECSGSTSIDISNMKDGDFAGLALLQRKYGLVGVKFNNGAKSIVMVNAQSGKPVEVQSVPLTQKTVYLKAECDFIDRTDIGYFYYSLDGKSWISIGSQVKMEYSMPHFMGYRFGLFNYSSKTPGGFVDFDWFHIGDQITKKN